MDQHTNNLSMRRTSKTKILLPKARNLDLFLNLSRPSSNQRDTNASSILHRRTHTRTPLAQKPITNIAEDPKLKPDKPKVVTFRLPTKEEIQPRKKINSQRLPQEPKQDNFLRKHPRVPRIFLGHRFKGMSCMPEKRKEETKRKESKKSSQESFSFRKEKSVVIQDTSSQEVRVISRSTRGSMGNP